MTILQNAYNSYLTKKYEKEINEFKKVALEILDKKIKTIELQYPKDISLRKLEWDTNTLKSIKHDVENKTLLLDTNMPSVLEIYDLLDEYEKLNDLIVKGETAQFVNLDEIISKSIERLMKKVN